MRKIRKEFAKELKRIKNEPTLKECSIQLGKDLRVLSDRLKNNG